MKNTRSSVYGVIAVIALVAVVSVYALTTPTTAQQPTSNVPPKPLALESVPEAPAVSGLNGAQIVLQEQFAVQPQGWEQADITVLPEERSTWGVGAEKLYIAPAERSHSFPTTYLAPEPFSEGQVAAQFFPQGNQIIGLVFNHSDEGYYEFTVYPDNSPMKKRYVLQRFQPETGAVIIAEVGEGRGYRFGEWQEVRIERSGSSIKGYFNGELVIETEDSALSKGRAGIVTLDMGDVIVDNFTIAQ